MYDFFRKWLPSSGFLFFYSIEFIHFFFLELNDFLFLFGIDASFLVCGFSRQLLFFLTFLSSFLFFHVLKSFQKFKYFITSMECAFFLDVFHLEPCLRAAVLSGLDNCHSVPYISLLGDIYCFLDTKSSSFLVHHLILLKYLFNYLRKSM